MRKIPLPIKTRLRHTKSARNKNFTTHFQNHQSDLLEKSKRYQQKHRISGSTQCDYANKIGDKTLEGFNTAAYAGKNPVTISVKQHGTGRCLFEGNHPGEES